MWFYKYLAGNFELHSATAQRTAENTGVLKAGVDALKD